MRKRFVLAAVAAAAAIAVVWSVLIGPGATAAGIDGSLALQAGRSPVLQRRSAGGARSCRPDLPSTLAQTVGAT
jgi:hypothetical protein